MKKAYTNFADFGKASNLLHLSLKLGEVQGGGLIGETIRHAANANTPARQLIDMVKDMATDNRGMMAEVLGETLLKEIENI